MSSVELISVTQPVNGKSAESIVAYLARVSNPKNQDNEETAAGLIRYLIRNEHWSPLEMVDICIEINTTRDIGRQILRHRSFVFQEFSQRYADVSSLGSYPYEIREARLQDTKNRQNSIELDPNNDLNMGWVLRQQEVLASSDKAYRWALENGIAKEQARAVLPEGLTKTRMYMKGSLRSWIHYCSLRKGNGTQKEHAEIASACWDIIAEQFPSIAEIFE